MTTEATVRSFFSSPQFAVVGASSNPAKFGHKVLAWYTYHDLPVTPVNPSTPTISAAGTTHTTVPSLSALKDPKSTSVSIITPPPVTLEVLKEAQKLGVPAVWLQPGTWDDAVLAFARGKEGAGGGGEEGVRYQGQVVAGDDAGSRGHGGWCVLVDGEAGLKAVGKL
ncbi:CoA binding domain-containing protein [Microdochium trichocladiopsis]|uniref:CoA binding domain-containing protein n=1 Tax=Microdochium trichocladiopsis TaxID=1682393 RepID=A0A9P8Y9S3_9PEZI|nr:CoA binding domain-containing protein [Microdochium trichocladiopsis]KAH7031551.1 CoA binding domain-containing protein [Microdochium trichocladiopsis]